MESKETYDEEYENIAVHKSHTVTYLQPKTCNGRMAAQGTEDERTRPVEEQNHGEFTHSRRATGAKGGNQAIQ